MSSFALSQLKCPSCHNNFLTQISEALCCERCVIQFPIRNGILDFLSDSAVDTQLDLETYDTHHGVKEENYRALFDIYLKNIETHAEVTLNTVLEIGSGTGNLTYGLCRYSPFKTVHCSDISLRFLAKLQERIAPVEREKIVLLYRLDTNNLPFNNQTLDIVVGHSVLHHISFFERTLKEVCRTLKRGGVAIFGEPILDAHAFISLVASMVLGTSNKLPHQEFLEKEKVVLEIIASNAVKKRRNLYSDRRQLESMEDKFIFPIEYMRRLSSEVGFKAFEVIQWMPVMELGTMIKDQLVKIFLQNRCNAKALDSFDYIFDSLTSVYGEALKESLSRPFGFFVFKK